MNGPFRGGDVQSVAFVISHQGAAGSSATSTRDGERSQTQQACCASGVWLFVVKAHGILSTSAPPLEIVK